MDGCPTSIEHLVGDPQFNMDVGSFGPFAQRMFDTGLVFNIEFTEDELGLLPRWNLFDRKIMDKISTLPAKLQLPSRPINVLSSVNTTLWSFVKCHSQAQRGHYGRRLYHLNPPLVPITPHTFTLETLIKELAMPNPISCPDDTPIPQHLIIIGVFFNVIEMTDLYLTPKSSSVSGLRYRASLKHRGSSRHPYQHMSLWLSRMLWIPHS